MKLFLFPLLFISFYSYSQSKEDTQLWLITNIENYANPKVHNELNVYFDEGDIWFVVELEEESVSNEIPLKEINQVSILQDSLGYVLIIDCTSGNACVRTKKYKTEDKQVIEVDDNKPDGYGVRIYLVDSLRDDNMVSRLKKALNHLITLNGGKIIDDVF